jgi:hypothetical protein
VRHRFKLGRKCFVCLNFFFWGGVVVGWVFVLFFIGLVLFRGVFYLCVCLFVSVVFCSL